MQGGELQLWRLSCTYCLLSWALHIANSPPFHPPCYGTCRPVLNRETQRYIAFLTVVEHSARVVVCYKEPQDKREAVALLCIQEACFLMRVCSGETHACVYIPCMQWRATPCGSCTWFRLMTSHGVSHPPEPWWSSAGCFTLRLIINQQ